MPAVVVGSSRGGAIAMNIDSGESHLVLLCPAWKKHGTTRIIKPSATILHSRADDVIPFADSEELVTSNGLSVDTLVEVGHDYRLADPESSPGRGWPGNVFRRSTVLLGNVTWGEADPTYPLEAAKRGAD